MIDILYNKLGSLNDAPVASLSEWKDVSPSIFNRHSQYPRHSPEVENVPLVPSVPPVPSVPSAQTQVVATGKNKKDAKATTIKPLDILMNETMSFHTSADYIKESIITLITRDEFSKIFGMTKCAEIMSGIVNNRWNKSTALFISFFLDKEVYYNDKVIVYNKEKNKGRITI
jgi:hypothetical protein